MDPREKVSVDEQRRLLLEEIRIYRYAIREHCLSTRARVTQTGRGVLNVGRKLQLVPAVASFLAGLLRGKNKPAAKGGRKRGFLRGLASTVLGGYALLKVLR